MSAAIRIAVGDFVRLILPPDLDGLVVRGREEHSSRGVVVDVADNGAVTLEPLHDSAARCAFARRRMKRQK